MARKIMTLFLVTYLGGVLTILSPCILPILPFVFSRTGRPFLTSTLPMLAGMAVMFAVIATLAAVGGGWVVQANEYGRVASMALLAIFGLTLVFPSLSDVLTRPVVAIGNRLSASADQGQRSEAVAAGLLGIALGFLWAPCAGPILGLLLTGAALEGASAHTSFLLLSYAAGAATALALALLAGGRVFNALKRSIPIGEWVRRALGVVVLVSVSIIALNLEQNFLAKYSTVSTNRIEQSLLDAFGENRTPSATADASGNDQKFPSLDGAVQWLNSPPLNRQALHGKVVLVNFWTYSCINCLRSLPYVMAWNAKYHDHGLVVIGVDSPEFAFERDPSNVARAVKQLGITYPVAVDSNLTIWKAFSNEYWPAEYLIDADGYIHNQHFGEGDYARLEATIQQFLAEAGYQNVPVGTVNPAAGGAELAADNADIDSPETYVGYDRTQNFASPQMLTPDAVANYTLPNAPQLNDWGLQGQWREGSEEAVLRTAPGEVLFRFHARDLHLILGPAAGNRPVRFRVLIDGAAPGIDHGADTDAEGNGTVTDVRLYQLVRQSGPIRDRIFTIEFLDPGVQMFDFTFG
jgi:cytochrome c biogenesis protein CcdA/thiol-disulfide isomerase/thioredoxin